MSYFSYIQPVVFAISMHFQVQYLPILKNNATDTSTVAAASLPSLTQTGTQAVRYQAMKGEQ
jgi:hypothetical protein